jgi:hypothetical protein
MRETTRDPITGNDVADRAVAPSVMAGQGDDALCIDFENESNRQAYLDVEAKHPDEALVRAYNGTTGKALEM